MLGINKNNIDNVMFQELMEKEDKIKEKLQEIKDLAMRAQGEVSLREAVTELKVWLETTEFELIKHMTSDNVEIVIIKEWKDLLTKVGDQQALLASLRDSKYASRFSDQLEQFDKKLGPMDELLRKLNLIQRKWVYLEPIFGRGGLPSEQHRFQRLDTEYRKLMDNISKDNRVSQLVTQPAIQKQLDEILEALEQCQKALNDFLEEKRNKFPRFYFLGDDDLLEILGQSSNLTIVQMHLKKLYTAIDKVEFQNNSHIIKIISSHQEKVTLTNNITIKDIQIEDWLLSLTNEMKSSLTNIFQDCLKEKQLQINNYPSQILQISENLRFSQQVIEAIKQQNLKNYKIDLQDQLQNMTKLSSGSKGLLQNKLKALILDLIHNIDVLNQLIENDTKNLDDWQWFKQLKYCMNQQGQLEINMCKARFNYSYEYQGNQAKLVHTPLTDKCYLTLTLGMHMGFGGCPYGPAGTGKTESVKALGMLLGRQVLVFNCDEGIDFKAMGRIFIGLVRTGSWGCFDEFNRLLEEQLSAISQQIQIIQSAIKDRQSSLILLSKTINVNKEAAIFVTMNPAGKGYGGRSKLPDNLKQLFRPVAMTTPNNELIAEVLLFAEGFVNAQSLANKVVSLFTLSKQLLSAQQHYDWGLRALKTCLNVAGLLMQQQMQSQTSNSPSFQESELLIKSIRINTLSKLTHSDSIRFKQLLDDVFPGVVKSDVVQIELEQAIEETITEMGLQQIEKQKQKILQFNEAIRQRTGAVLVGPSGCGKSTIWKVLKKALERMKNEVNVQILNPKALSKSQLLGWLNQDTREFTSGVLTAAARTAARENSNVMCWVICDGDVDPEWIESLNSVLDDNRLLTLPTGERISFGSNVNFIFETNDLQYASPATISRMGMILLSEQDLPINSIIQKWLQNQPQSTQNLLSSIIFKEFLQLNNWINTKAPYQSLPISTTQLGRIMSVLVQLNHVENKQLVILGMLRGMAANLDVKYRSELSQYLFTLFELRVSIDLNKYPLEFTYNNNDFTILKNDITLIQELGSIEEPYAVLTVGLQRDLNVIEKWLNNLEPIIVVGPEGCGKSLLIRTAIKQLTKQQAKVNLATIHCNAQTTADNIIQKLQQVCIKGTCAQGSILKPKDCSRLILYLKDINLPKPDKYQTIQLIAFLQQLITHKGYYDDNLEFVYLEDKIQIIASMAPSSTMGRHPLSTRFTANVRVIAVDYPSLDELQLIYQQYINLIYKQYNQQVSAFLVDFYQQIKTNFTVDNQRHYQFTPRELTRIIFRLQKHSDYNNDKSLFFQSIYWESCRIFMDRLVSINARNTFINILQQLMLKHLQYDIKNQGQFIYTTLSNNKKLEKLNIKDFNTVFNKGIIQYEREVKELNFKFLQEHKDMILGLDNSLNNNQSVLICGRSGMGRKTCVQLISFLNGMKFFSPMVGRDYGIREFRKELKQYLEIVGGQNTNSVLFIEDYQIINSEVLEQINSLISAGEVPGLISQEEMEAWLGQQAEDLRREYWGKTLYESFCIRVKKNLRVVLSLDYANDNFQSQCASNPSFYNNCNIIWSIDLSIQSMQQLCEMELQSLNPSSELSVNAMSIHNASIEKLGFKISPRHYNSFINTYSLIYQSKLGTQGAQSNHLSLGLQKLKEAEVQVDTLSKDAQFKKEQLNIKQTEADQALKQITIAMENAARRKSETENMQENLKNEEQVIQQSKQRIEQELSSIMPQVKLAQEAVGSISKSNINELKSFMMPVETIHDILSAVLRIFGNQDTSWNSMKKFISQKGIIESIINYDPRNLSSDVRQNLQGFIGQKKASFDKQTAYRASQAAGPLAEWVVAMLKLSFVLEEIAPLENQQKKIQNNLNQSKAKCEENMKQLQLLDKQVQELKENFQNKTGEAASLKRDLEITQQTLQNANSLLQKLSGEKHRWMKQLEQYQEENKMLPLNSLLASAFTVYLSQEDEETREKMVSNYRQIVKCNEFNYLRFMTSENQVLKLKAEGLPGDTLSLENSAAILHSYQCSLIIDPNYQATQWLITNLANAEELVQFEKKYSNSFELAVRFGKTLIIKELNTIDPLLVPILRKDIIRQGQRNSVQLADKLVDYSNEFRLFLCTRNTSILLPSFNKALVNLVNFTVTKSGLENKLLSIVIDHEQPELEQKKSALVQQEENLKIQLADLEKQLLVKLAESKGNILQNTELIESLEQTKDKSIQIQKSLQESNKLQISLDEQRNVYRPLASQGALLFLLLNDMYKINNMYRFSLEQFIMLFKKSLLIEFSLNDSFKKMEFAQSNLYRNTVNNIGGALFKQDRLAFGLHLIQGLKPNLFEKNEWEFFLNIVVGSKSQSDNIPNWIPSDRHESFQYLTGTFPIFRNIQWNELEQTLMKNASPEKQLGIQFKQKLSEFQRIMMLQSIRPDRVNLGLQSFICDGLNLQSILGLGVSLEQIFKEQSNNRNPILFIVSAGSDPSKELEEFGISTVGKDKIKELSMGGGQDEIAIQMLREATTEGHWLIFKNLHLVTHWLPLLEKELRICTNPHPDFRFWLTTEPHLQFPSILLETCLKFSYEAPPGIKKNLQRLSQSTSHPNEPEKLTLQLALNWFHALLQERRIYIPQGWSKFYEFSYSDLKSAQLLIEEQFRIHKSASKFQWQTINGLIQDAIYGGRIDNEYDLKVLQTYVQQIFNKQTVEGNINLSVSIQLPKVNNTKDINQFINKLPENDNPNVFGLPSNIEKAVQRRQMQEVINSLKVLRRMNSQNEKFDKEKWNNILSPFINLWKQSQQDLKDIPQVSESNNEDSLFTFIESEIIGARSTIQQVNQTIQGLISVLQGSGLLTPQIFNQANVLLKSEVPKEWYRFWEGPENNTKWYIQFVKKASQLQQWLSKTKHNTLLQSEINLSQIFHPEIFLNCFRQMTARKLQQSVDNLKLEASFDRSSIKSQNVLIVQGLYLQGAGFKNNIICDPDENQPEFISISNIFIAWTPITSLDIQFNTNNLMDIPLFHSISRENVLCKISLPVQGKSQRILAGTGLFLNNQD